ncbi:TetR/AcrR family transcriptional regulator [Actinoplanes sp. KI2]|uniref:TetR/AcrR family transcriptional regulator n=1 Tax=Actinoplanes sp. KI2 TaxID=2983315 RepID=UPI0021D5ABF7|nr:TetR/AcrR family transcriptional regulator [Actinoplanes sp. KI2]MCU7723136.1 TetR/AcrR family transcriptional regulator [Actinoplanes sp. KI2]
MDERTAVGTRRGENYGGRTREERAADRRDRILASALQLFGTRDYEDVTVAEVCTGARVSKRYFYEHFVDREDLARALQKEQNEWLLAGVVAATPPSPRTVEEVMRPAVHQLLTMLRANPRRAQVIYINAPRMETRRRGVLREDAQFLAWMLRRVSPQTKDRIRYERLLLALVAGLSEVIIDWLSRGMTDDLDDLADHLTAYCQSVLAAA